MYLRKNFNKKTGIYRTKSAIEHFKFKVTLKTLHSLIKVPQFQISENVGTTTPISDDPDEIESHTIHWQEKRLSRKEIEQFNDPNNCKTDMQKDYLQIIREKNLNTDAKKAQKLFTYITDDLYVPSIEIESKNEKLNTKKYEIMYIMADLQEETILFTIKWHTDGLILIYPDFNDLDDDPYLIEIDSDSRHMYQYAIENICDDSDLKRNLIGGDIDRELQIMSKRLSELSIKTLFDLPPRRCTNVYLLFEIKSAKYFEYDNIHVRYHIILPNRCIIINNNGNALPSNKCPLEGSTHSSLKCQNNDSDGENIWKFGYCQELDILCNEDYRFNDFLKISYEIISIDEWNRERIEGYTCQRIPFIAGMTTEMLPCYRDLGNNTIIERLERYFIGGRKKFDRNKFNGISSTEPFTKLNRYGNQMKSTGYLYVSNQIIVQHDVSILDNVQQRKCKKNETDKNRLTIDDVIIAYQKAKLRLEEATDKQ